MQMCSLFNVKSITVSTVKVISDIEPIAYYRCIDVRYTNGGSAVLMLYANSEEELEMKQEEKED